jgi:hypothetical protein
MIVGKFSDMMDVSFVNLLGKESLPGINLP